MNEKSVLDRLRLPARLDSAQSAELLGFQEHDIPVLVRGKLLHYLGKDLSPNSRKFFSSAELQGLADNREWLAKATQAVARTWQEKNRKLKDRNSRAEALPA